MPGDSAAPKGLAVSEVVAEEDEVTLRSGERLSPHCSHIQGDFLTHSPWPWSVTKKNTKQWKTRGSVGYRLRF